jgi:hypothetical protein
MHLQTGCYRLSDGDVLRGLEARLSELEESVRRGGDRSVLGKVFAVNNEIGRAVREHPPMKRALLELQLNVNAITVSIKAGDAPRAARALEASLRSFSKLKEEFVSPKKNL